MRVVMLNLAYGRGLSSPENLLEYTSTLTGCAEGLVRAGARVAVVQRFAQSAHLAQRGVEYRFVSDGFDPLLRFWQIPLGLMQQVKALQPEVVHINGLMFAWQAAALRQHLPARIPILMQHHAEQPSPGWRGLVKSHPLRWLDGFIFTTPEQAQPWQHRGFIRKGQKVFGVMEGSCTFSPKKRDEAQRLTGMQGNPVLLWVGRLDTNKDPLTVLAAFEQVLVQFAKARLYMVHGPVAPSDIDLLFEVQGRIQQSTTLSHTVKLLGQVPHAKLETIYNSADVFVLGSHREGSGYALAEALACGVVPVVTHIPSFRFMTNQGKLGMLWTPGNVAACAQAIAQVLRNQTFPLKSPGDSPQRKFFEQQLSFAAIGRELLAAYEVAQRPNSLPNP